MPKLVAFVKLGEPAARAKGEPKRPGNTPLVLGLRRGLAAFPRYLTANPTDVCVATRRLKR
jgi:hypothetical protein